MKRKYLYSFYFLYFAMDPDIIIFLIPWLGLLLPDASEEEHPIHQTCSNISPSNKPHFTIVEDRISELSISVHI